MIAKVANTRAKMRLWWVGGKLYITSVSEMPWGGGRQRLGQGEFGGGMVGDSHLGRLG